MDPKWKGQFATLWVGQAVSILTSSISQYALIWYITAQTGSATVLSIATMVGLLPQGILSLFTGAVADRFDRRKIMAIADGGIGLVSLWLVGVGVFQGELPIWAIMVTLALRSVGSAFHGPCLQAVTPLLVPKEKLGQCAGWSQGIQTASLLASPALAAILFASIPLHWIIALDTIGAAFAMLFMCFAHLPELREPMSEQFHLWNECKEGYGVLCREPWLWQMCVLCGLFSVAVVPVTSLFPLVCMETFGGSTTSAAVVQTAYSLGMLVGALYLGVRGSGTNKMTTITTAVFVVSGCLLSMGALTGDGFYWFTVLALVMGVASPFFNSLIIALIQERVEGQYLGRVLGVNSAIITLASPIGLTASAVFADRVGLLQWFGVAGVLAVTCGVLCMVLPSVRQCDKSVDLVIN